MANRLVGSLSFRVVFIFGSPGRWLKLAPLITISHALAETSSGFQQEFPA
jgi:hypothetical protein